MKKILCLILALVCVFTSTLFVSANVNLPEGVTQEMCSADFWKSRIVTDACEVLMNAEDVKAFNKASFDGSGTYIVGIENIKPSYDADSQRLNMRFDIPSRDLYIDGKKIDNESYFQKINDAIVKTGYTDKEKETEYAVVTKLTNMKYIPTLDVIGYSPFDSDDEYEYENLCLNEPFAVRQMCIIDGIKFYYGWSMDCVGWVAADDLAICKDREEWLDAWYNEIDAKDFIVVTEDKFNLEMSLYDGYSSNLKLTLGTSLKLVEKENIPAEIDGRNTWNNYTVYIPARDSNGKYIKRMALISQHHGISIGYLPYTQANVLDVAFSCLGNRYGWGGMLDTYDCSLYTRTVYRCFGLTYPRNSGWQLKVPDILVDLSGMTDEEKQKFIETLPSGTALSFSGHTMLYLGTVDDVSYVISALGTVVETSGPQSVQNVYNISITPLTVRRGASYNYSTWLHCLSSAIMVMPKTEIGKCDISARLDCFNQDANVSVRLENKELFQNVNYTVTKSNDDVTITGINNFSGSVTLKASRHIDVDRDGYCDECDKNISANIFQRIIKFFKTVASLT